jgi:tyrosyl-tRNA synthetase
MWRYYELLTDVSMADIKSMQAAVAIGGAHPMKLKQELGKRIVADFHSAEAAEQAAQDWSRMFQKDEVPEDLPLIAVKFDEVAAPNAAVSDGVVQVKLDKLLARTGLATSVTDGLRKVKQNAVKVDGELKTEIVATVKAGTEFTLRAGKKMVKVSVTL